jgi:hypothetical protein
VGEYKTAELLAADVAARPGQLRGFAEAWPERSGDRCPILERHGEARRLGVTAGSGLEQHTPVGRRHGDRSDCVEEAAGADILVAGSATLVRSLFEADLVDGSAWRSTR